MNCKRCNTEMKKGETFLGWTNYLCLRCSQKVQKLTIFEASSINQEEMKWLETRKCKVCGAETSFLDDVCFHCRYSPSNSGKEEIK